MAGRVVGKGTFKGGDSGGSGGGFQAGIRSRSGGGVAPLQPARRETIFKTVFNDIKVKIAQRILTRYTTPETIGNLKQGELGQEMRKQSMGKFGVQQAELLISLARDTIGIKEGVAGITLDIRHILVQLQAVNGFIQEIETEMEKTLERIPWSTRILSMKGLGVITVAGLIGEVGDFFSEGNLPYSGGPSAWVNKTKK